jgi:lysophospholipase L1-like esterase
MPVVGVTADPCAGVPLRPDATHARTADPHASWMRDWLALDWGQLCRYRAANAALPPATATRSVFFGDSITEGWRALDPGFFGPDTLDRGISGQTTAQMLVRFRADVIELQPAVVHIMAGTNDIAGNTGPTSLTAIQGRIRSMVELARAHRIGVILGSIPPAARFRWRPELRPVATIAAMNDWLRGYARQESLIYADYHAALADERGAMRPDRSDDGVHPNAAGYAAMRPIARAALDAALARSPAGPDR